MPPMQLMVAVSGGSATLPHMFIRTKHDPERKRTRIQIVQSVRTGQKVRQKVVRHVGIAHNDTEVADLKRLAGRIMEELRASQSPQMELFTPTEYADLATLVRTAPRPEKLNVDLGECREESRLSLGLRDVMGEVYWFCRKLRLCMESLLSPDTVIQRAPKIAGKQIVRVFRIVSCGSCARLQCHPVLRRLRGRI